ncbi:MAG: flagellar motor switch protein FliN [Porticoccaceae bacterium]|nr:flagellar motor switch protein FliN [Porticoccaceae bacterium]
MSDDQNNETDELNADPEATATDDYAAAPLKNLAEGSPEGNGDNTRVKDEQDINLDVILDVPITISVEIGRTQVPIRDLLRYSQGSVIELDRLVSEPLDVLVNNTLIAHGEVVVVDDQFGIRLTDVISPSERVKKLK